MDSRIKFLVDRGWKYHAQHRWLEMPEGIKVSDLPEDEDKAISRLVLFDGYGFGVCGFMLSDYKDCN